MHGNCGSNCWFMGSKRFVTVCASLRRLLPVCDSLWQPARHKLFVTVTLPTLSHSHPIFLYLLVSWYFFTIIIIIQYIILPLYSMILLFLFLVSMSWVTLSPVSNHSNLWTWCISTYRPSRALGKSLECPCTRSLKTDPSKTKLLWEKLLDFCFSGLSLLPLIGCQKVDWPIITILRV